MKNIKIFPLKQDFAWAKIFALFAIISLLTRTVFLVRESANIDFSLLMVIKVYLVGVFFDLITISYLSFIPLIYYIAIPNRFFVRKFHLYFILSLFLAAWSIVFNYSKRFAFFQILITLGLSLFLYFYKFNKRSSYLLIPLILWLAFASLLNYYSI